MASNPENRINGLREAWSILLIALCALLLLSLFSYDWHDIPLLQSPPNDPIYNFIGAAGAWTSFVLFMLLGLGAYLLPVWFLVFGLMVIFKGQRHLRAKVGLVTLFMLALACLLELQTGFWEGLCRYLNIPSAGGVIVQYLTQRVLLPLLGEIGTAILASALLLAAVVLFLGIETIYAAWLRAGGAVRTFLRRQRDRRADRLGEVISARAAKSGGAARPAAPEPQLPLPEEPEERPAAAARRGAREEPKAAVLNAESAPPTRGAAAREPEPERPEKPAAPAKPVRPKPEPPPAKPEAAAPPPRAAPQGGAFNLPGLELLAKVAPAEERAIKGDVETTARIIRETLADFGIEVTVENIESGPVVTRYELLPAAGVRVERIAGLSNNLALSLKATSVRVQAPIPGRGLVGVEVPNSTASVVYLREILESAGWRNSGYELPLALGQDVSGKVLVSDLAAMPHMLIAGATGSGKTVCMNSILIGLFMNRTPDELRMILIDPKIVEFSIYNHMPHLEVPVITNPKKVSIGLQWAIKEMEKRYKIFAKAGVRNIKSYNSRLLEKQGELFPAESAAAAEERKPMPYIVIVVDELADLMLTAQAEIENAIARLAQLSRAVGIHMILATQRPSVNVITGTIKANFPARIAFQVAQKVDSRTILDANGADKLLGRGDMLFLPPGSSKLVRAQGAMTTDADIHVIVDFWKRQAPPPELEETPAPAAQKPTATEIPRPRPPAADVAEAKELSLADMMASGGDGTDGGDDAELIEQSIAIIRETHRASTSSLQRRLRIGYTRAARVMDVLEERGIVGPARGSDPREILIDLDGEIPDNPTVNEPDTDEAPA